MSDIYTLSQLSDCLAQDLAWRKKELFILKTLIETKGFESSKKNVLMRSGVAVLYAHWEGYIKNSANAYLQFISKQKSLKYCEVKNNFIAIAMKKKLNEITETNKSTIHNQYFGQF